jgi:pimeloyl-ACP methyl ester carboxylesterase
MEQHVFFENRGERLLGVLHIPDNQPARPGALVFLHGWAGYRIGPHQMFTKLARRACEDGFTCLRFDFRGRGDSEGEAKRTTLSTMISDAVAGAKLVGEKSGLSRIALIGDCSGSEVSIGAAPLVQGIDSQVLWSAPIVGADRAASDRAKKQHILKQYAGKLLRKETWRKLLGGKLQFDMIKKAALGGGKGAGEEGAEEDKDIDWLRRFHDFKGDILFVYGGNDPVTPQSVEHYTALTARADRELNLHVVEGANHAFYSLAWENEVMDVSLEWLRRRYPMSASR